MKQIWEAWQQMADDSIARTTAFCAEIDKLETKGIERAAFAVDEWAKLTKETFTYSAQLGAEFRKLSLDAMKRASSGFGAAVS